MWYVLSRRATRVWTFLFLGLLVLTGAPGGLSWAQEPPTFELPEVTVPGRRPQPVTTTPASVSVLTRADLDRLGVRTVADALRLLPELNVRTYGGLGSLAEPSIRGSTPGQVLVLLDSVPVNNVALGQTDLSTISTDTVDRIEVLRGPFAAIYGSGALGGVINIVSSRGGQSQAFARAGGFGERSLHGALTGAQSLPWRVGLTVDAAVGHRPNSDYTGSTFAASIPISPSARFVMHHYRADLGTPGDVSSPTPADRQSQRRTLAQVEWRTAGADRFTGRVYYAGDYLVFTTPFGSSVYPSTMVGGEIQRAWSPRTGRLITAGSELLHQALNATVFGTQIVGEATVGAGYLQYDASLSPRLLASIGLRLDAHSRYGTTLNPRAGTVYQVNPDVRVRAGIGRTFRGPTFLHLFFPGCSNPDLRPETAWAAELGIERQVQRGTFSLTAFGAEAADLIAGFCPPQNVGAAAIRGVSAELKGAMNEGVSGFINITATQAIDRATGASLLRVPAIAANAALVAQVSPTSTLSVVASYVGTRPDLDFSTFPPATVQMPAYIDVRLRYQISTVPGWMITVGVNNALDQRYEPVKGYPAPGRSVFMTATKSF